MQKFFFFSCLLFISTLVNAARFIELGQSILPTGISNDGRVVAGITNPSSFSPDIFTWSAGTGIRELGLPTTTEFAEPYLSSDGSIVVGEFYNARSFSGFIHSDLDGLTILENQPIHNIYSDGNSYLTTVRNVGLARVTLAGDVIEVINRETPFSTNAISADGSTLIGSNLNREAIRWTNETGFFDLGLPNQNYAFSDARGVSADGNTIVGFFSSNGDLAQPFIWTPDELLMLDVDVSGNPYSLHISDDGRFVAGNIRGSTSNDHNGGFLWTRENGLQTLDSILTGKDIDLVIMNLFITALSPDGNWITVTNLDSTTNISTAYLVNISSVPIPSTFWLFGSALLALIAKKKFIF